MAYPLGATAINGLPVTLRVDTGSAVIANGMITVNELGTVWVTAEQAGDATHAPVRVSRSFNVRRAVLNPLGGVDTGGQANALQVVGNYAYFAAGTAGLQVIDVSNPVNPVRVGGYDTIGTAEEVHVVGDHAFVAEGGLRVIDVSNPAKPVRVGAVETSGHAEGVQTHP